MPDVSVVIPSFRGGSFLHESIASVQSQTLEDWELIVVLDGCEEDLSDVEKKDERVRVIRQRQKGVSVARNVGVMHARSELVAFLDDDDRMLPNRLQAQVGAMKDAKVGLCHTQFRFIDENGAFIGPGISREAQYRDFLRGDGVIYFSTTMARKSLIQELGGFNPLLYFGEDLDLVFRIARESTVRFLPDVLVEYRRHGKNVWFDTAPGGREIKLILTQHKWVAEARGDADDLLAIRTGMSAVMSGRASIAMFRAREAQSRHDYRSLLVAFGQAFLLSPRATMTVMLRAFKRDRAAKRAFDGVASTPAGDGRAMDDH